MKSILGVSAAVLAVAMMFVQPASATNEVCKKAVTVEGHTEHGERAAMKSAIRHWQHEVSHDHGAAFADWYYSADRTVTCKWDDKGIHYTCKTTAKPCGPKR